MIMFVSAFQCSNFTIGLTDVSPWTTQPPMVDQGPPCAYYPGTVLQGSNTTICCDPQSSPGRYLFVKREDDNVLSFCEVDVFSALPRQVCMQVYVTVWGIHCNSRW